MQEVRTAFKVAILGCGTVGGGVARILLDQAAELQRRAGRAIKIARIIDLYPASCAARHSLPLNLFAGDGADLSPATASAAFMDTLADPEIDLVVETIGGSSTALRDNCLQILQSNKHLVSANKALLAIHGTELFRRARQTNQILGFEGAVCGAIPVIRSVRDGFAGDIVESFSGIMNGTSNYILSQMQEEGLAFDEALKLAQAAGYAEADPHLDISGGDAGHKLALLAALAFGLPLAYDSLSVQGIQTVTLADLRAARELNCVIKLICHAQRGEDGVHAAVGPAMVKSGNFLSRVNGATNAVRFLNRFGGEQILVGQGAGSLETGSAVVADIVFIARYQPASNGPELDPTVKLFNLNDLALPYVLILDTEDVPGVTGLVTTAIGEEGINIDTVGHNLHSKDSAVFCVETMACPRSSIDKAIQRMLKQRPGIFRDQPKIYPVFH